MTRRLTGLEALILLSGALGNVPPAPKLKTSPCQCEHEAHFEHTAHTPNGNPGHVYGSHFRDDDTPNTYMFQLNGSYRVCKDCRDDCMADYK